MKSYSLAVVVALLCIAVVSTAPSTSTNSNKPETFTSISDKLKCARDVTVDLVNDAELKDELDEFKEAIDVLWKENDLCIKKANGNVVALYKCQVEATKTYYTAFFKFISEVSKKRNDLVKKILGGVKNCLMESNAL